MKLLIITQKVDQHDAVLGFFHRWIVEFAIHFDVVTVVCLEKGLFDVPSNVSVRSLGKEDHVSRGRYVGKLFSYIWSERKNYDAVFVHMNPVYVVLAGWYWKLLRKPIYLWYVHRSVDLKLRVASWFVDSIFTAAKESCRLNSSKIRVVGHGIDTAHYATVTRPTRLPQDPIRIIHVGRITKIKNCDTLVAAAGVLMKTWSKPFEVVFIGEPVTGEDIEYKRMLETRIKELGVAEVIRFAGSVPNNEIVTQYAQADVAVNLAPTGGIDKSVLESLASGVPTFFSNEAFLDVFSPYENLFHIAYKDADMLAEKIKTYLGRADGGAIESELRSRTVERFSVTSLISRISGIIHDTA